VQLEKEQFTWLQSTKRCAAGSPEIDFVQVGPVAKVIEPVTIGNRYN
jgi:hypothetical protein